MGMVLLMDLISRLGSIGAFYSDEGAVPRHAVTSHLYRALNVSIHFITGSATLQTFLFLINAILILCFILGYRSRLMTILCWFFYVSMINRNPLIVHGGDVVVRTLLFWAMFMPLGLSYSVDAALIKTPQPEKKLFSPACVAIMMQLLFVYFFSAIHKSHVQWFPEGTAIAYALQLHAFELPLGIYMRQFPSILKPLTYNTYFLELLGPILILIPFRNMWWRMPIILGFIGLHLGIFLTMKIGLFPWMCIAAWMIFLPSEFWDYIAPHFLKKTGLKSTIYFDADCGFCKKSVYIIRHLLLLKDTNIQEGQSNPEVFSRMTQENSWIIQDPQGNLHSKYDAFVTLVDLSVFSFFLKPIVSFKPIRLLGSRTYHWVSHNRNLAGKLTNSLSWNEKPYHYSKVSLWLVVFFFFIVVMNNLGGLKWEDVAAQHFFQTPQILKPFNRIFRIDQSWDMFAPKPMGTNTWYLIAGTTFSGKALVLLNEDPRDPSQRKADFENLYPDHRWSKFTRNLILKENEDYLLYYGKYLCRKTNREIKGTDKLERFSIKLIKQTTSLNNPNPNEYRESTIWNHKCSGAR
jgi:predicted DCC family thiol-disulfide oxidoreductase YuxK